MRDQSERTDPLASTTTPRAEEAEEASEAIEAVTTLPSDPTTIGLAITTMARALLNALLEVAITTLRDLLAGTTITNLAAVAGLATMTTRVKTVRVAEAP